MMKSFNFLLSMFCVGLVVGCVQNKQQEQPLYDNVTVVDELVIDENSVPIFPKKAALTTDTARRFSIELPKRCLVDWNRQNVVSVVPEENIEIMRLAVGDPLPDLPDVVDFEFKKLTVKQALDKLLYGTDIAVIEDEDFFETITGNIPSGQANDIIELVTKMGRAYYSYDASNSAMIIVSSCGIFIIHLPRFFKCNSPVDAS